MNYMMILLGLLTTCAAANGAETDETAKEVAEFRRVVRSKDVKEFSRAALALRRYMIEHDPHRPIYHFTGPESWINDANGVIYHRGPYHLFYQFDPIVDGERSARCWGHAVSDDLVHWEDWPIAIWPDTQYDRNGVYSGNMVIDDNGVPTALYTGNVDGHRECYGMLARSHDGMLTWEKKMVMDTPPYPGTPVHWDGQAWKEGDTWYQLIGGTKEGKGAALIWTSLDLESWTYQKPIYTSEPGKFWELPYLVPLGDRYALMIGVGGNPYWIGSYDSETMTFTPDRPETRSADPGHYYAVNPNMADDRGPGGSTRRIMHGWVRNPPSPTETVPYWQGIHSIPRVLTLGDGRIIQEPIPEIQVLRGEKRSYADLGITPQSSQLLAGINGDALEIIAAFLPGNARRFGLRVRVSADGETDIPVWYDPQECDFGVGDIRSPSDLKSGEPVQMRVFVDRSVIEAYVNGNIITKVSYLDPDAQGVGVFAEDGNCVLESIDVWKMNSMW